MTKSVSVGSTQCQIWSTAHFNIFAYEKTNQTARFSPGNQSETTQQEMCRLEMSHTSCCFAASEILLLWTSKTLLAIEVFINFCSVLSETQKTHREPIRLHEKRKNRPLA